MKVFRKPVLALAAVALFGATAMQAQAQAPSPMGPVATHRTLNPPPVPAPTGGAPTVGGVTVQPQTVPKGRVVASTDAASITSPNYTDEDAKPAPRALKLGDQAAVGVESVDAAPIPGTPSNLDPGGAHGDVGVTAVF